MNENKQIKILLLLQETLPEEAAGHNPLLPTAPQQEETSPTSKVTFFSQIPKFFSSPKRYQCSQHSHLMRRRNSNCCQPLQSSPLMITPLAFAASSQPLWEFLSQETLQSTSPLSAGREVEHDRLRKDAPVYRDD